ncbi:MAG: hypothetical protein WBD55_11305 [Dehalococcoidia bacterium]
MAIDRTACLNCQQPGVQLDENVWALVRLDPMGGDVREHDVGNLDLSISLRARAAICTKCGFLHLFAILPK